MGSLSLTFFNAPSPRNTHTHTHTHTQTHIRTLLIVFHPLTLLLTLLNPHVHLSLFSASLLGSCQTCLASLFAQPFSSPHYSLFPCIYLHLLSPSHGCGTASVWVRFTFWAWGFCSSASLHMHIARTLYCTHLWHDNCIIVCMCVLQVPSESNIM